MTSFINSRGSIHVNAALMQNNSRTNIPNSSNKKMWMMLSTVKQKLAGSKPAEACG